MEVEKLLSGFFSNDVKNLEIPEYQCEDNLHKRLPSYQALQAILSISIWVTQASMSFSFFQNVFLAFTFHMTINILYWRKSKYWLLKKLLKASVIQS